MLLRQTRRDLIKYGIGAASFSKLTRAQMLQAINNDVSAVAPIALLTHTVKTGAAGITTDAIDTSGATLLVVGLATSAPNTQAGNISDSKSNTWTALNVYGTANTIIAQLFYVANPTVGSGHTVTFTPGGSFSTLLVASFSLVATSSPFDQQNGAPATAAATLQPGSITPGAGNELVVTLLDSLDPDTVSIDSGFTQIDHGTYSSGVNLAGALAYKVQTTAAAVNPTWTATGCYAASIASFKHQ